jgi:short-subunit dehydrogenase
LARPVAVITGASSGLGAIFARKLAAKHDLLLIARRKERLDELAREVTAQHGCSANVLAADLSDEKDLASVADRIATEEKLALLVNNAGFGTRGLFWELDVEVQEQMHRLQIKATVRLSHAALRNMMKKNAGAIVNVASVAGFARRSGAVSYGSTKAWMIAFTESLYLELRSVQSAVKVQALCPGFTYTEFHDTAQIERKNMAPPWLWLRAEYVVDQSLKGLGKGKLFVIPAWRYKAIVTLVTKLPTPLRLAFEAAGSKKRFGGR